MTGIEWTEATWNPVTGCNKLSPGCKFCYAEALSKRLEAMGNPRYKNGFQLTLHADKVTEPVGWKKPTVVFVNSMSDLLHRDVPTAFILDCIETMAVRAPQHTYQVLTKRAERWPEISAAVLARYGRWPRNVWPGVSIESAPYLSRLEPLGLTGDAQTIRMISAEPLLSSLAEPDIYGLAERLRAHRIGWVISGGESGFEARPAQMDWFREIRDACTLAGVDFFHKQHGGIGVSKWAKKGGAYAELDGVIHHATPPLRSAFSTPDLFSSLSA